MKKLILIPDRVIVPDIEQNIFGNEYEIETFKAVNSEQIPDEKWNNADAILAWHEIKYDEKLIKKLKKCKAIVRVGVGFDNVDLKIAKENNIIVCNVPDYGTTDVADHAMAMILSLSRGLIPYNEYVRSFPKLWEWNIVSGLRRLAGSVLGIIGLGRIGKAVALRAKAFQINVFFYDPYISDGNDKSLGINQCDNLSDMLKISDIVSIHAPLTDETKNMADEKFFSLMKKESCFINTARGKIMDLDALYNAMKKNHIVSAGLDVFPKEPIDENHSLFKEWKNKINNMHNRLILTPHSAFYCKESFEEMRKKSAIEALRILKGKAPRNNVGNSLKPFLIM